MNTKIKGCKACATAKGAGCVIFMNEITHDPIMCPCGYPYPKFEDITKMRNILHAMSKGGF